MKKNTIALLVLISLTLLILILIFGRVLQNPNNYVFSNDGDAIKSYYNFTWYLRYDSGIRHDAVNYPYGDHLQYMNSHPLYVQFIKFIDSHITQVAKLGVGILNFTMIISLLLAAPFLFLILRRFALPSWYAVIMSLVILFLSPQLNRMAGHFEMVYAFFIPLYWYLLLRWDEEKRYWLWGTLLIVTALAGGFTSAYYVTFFFVFSLAYLLVQLWVNRMNLHSFYRKGLYLLTIAVLPILIVKGLVTLTDWVDDRPDNPWGFFIFHSNIWSIFLPDHSSLWELLGSGIDMSFNWEGRAFVGLPATLLVLSLGYYLVYSLLSWKKPDYRIFFPNKRLNAWLISAFLVLLISMCVPFKWNLQFLVDLIPSLSQFRCLGRFSWIFYYVFTVYSAYIFYTLFRRMKQKGLGLPGSIVLFIVIGFWTSNAAINIKRSTAGIFNNNEVLMYDDEIYLEKFTRAGVDPHQFQAILFLPFTNTSGDKLLHPRGHTAFVEAMKCSHHTGLPLIQSFSPRLSFQQALSSIQLLADTSIYKIRTEDMNDKPVLLVMTKEELKGPEYRLKEMSEIFFEDDKLILASLPLNAFNKGYKNWVDHGRSMADSLTGEGQVLADYPGVYYDGFDVNPAPYIFSGDGALYRKKGPLEIYNGELFALQPADSVEISFWLYVDHRTFSMPEAELHLWDNKDMHVERIKIETREVHNVYGKWIRVHHHISPKPGIRYQLLLKGKFISVDDLLLRPVDSNVLVRRQGNFDLFNNFPLSK
jgi:hypothetical protein